MPLPGQTYQRLQVALLSAFPTPHALTELLKFRLDVSLEEIVIGQNYREVVYRVIEWAVSHDRLRELVQGAREENPGNPELQSVAGELEGAAPPTNDVNNLVPLLRWADANGQLGQLIALACGPGGASVDIRAFVTRTMAAATDRAPAGSTELLELAEKMPTPGGRGGLEVMPGLESFGPRPPVPPQAPSAEEIAAARAEIIGLADRFEAIRSSMRTSPARTGLQEGVASQMRMLAPKIADMLAELSQSDRLGQRLAAVTILQEQPRADYLDWLAERQRAPEAAFTAYHAAIALRNAARAPSLKREDVRRAIERAIDETKARYPANYRAQDRYQVLDAALALVAPGGQGQP